MNHTTLIIPGFHGSGPTHWQTWLEDQLPEARRVSGIDWEAPILTNWVVAVRRAILQSSDRVWLVAHSFGCLAAVTAGNGLAEHIAGALLVAPADPDRFSPLGLRVGGNDNDRRSLATDLPQRALPFPSLILASGNDPWMPTGKIKDWARRWGSGVIDIGHAGHINTESGFGPWPEGLALLRAFQDAPLHRRRADQDWRSGDARRSSLTAPPTLSTDIHPEEFRP